MSVSVGKGTFLIANPNIMDPNFVKTVVLICEYNEHGAFGLVLNRNSNVDIAHIFTDIPGVSAKHKNIYFGGPVDTNKIFCLHNNRAYGKKYDCEAICDDVYLGSHKDCITNLAASKDAKDIFRLYLGCSCWSEGQLENEIDMHVWIVGPANSDLVFYPNTDQIWWYVSRFIDGFDHEASDPVMN